MAVSALREVVVEKTAVPTTVASADKHGRSAAEYDQRHAVLIIREAPRIGATLSNKDGASLRRYLEAKELRYRSPTGRIIFATDHFLLDAITERDQERMSISYSLGRPTAQTSSASGRSARIYSHVGHLLSNAIEPSALTEWRDAWDTYVRASRLVRGHENTQRAVPLIAEVYWRDQFRRGYLTRTVIDMNALEDSRAVVSFDMFVIQAGSLHQSGTTDATTTPLSPSDVFKQYTATHDKPVLSLDQIRNL